MLDHWHLIGPSLERIVVKDNQLWAEGPSLSPRQQPGLSWLTIWSPLIIHISGVLKKGNCIEGFSVFHFDFFASYVSNVIFLHVKTYLFAES